MTEQEKERLKTWVQDAVIYSIGHRCLDREKKEKHKEHLETLLSLIDRVPTINTKSWFWKNCKRQRTNGAKICQECPFMGFIEALGIDEEAKLDPGKKYVWGKGERL